MRDSGLQIEIALRAARLAKSALELMNMDPSFCSIQLSELTEQIKDIRRAIEEKGGVR